MADVLQGGREPYRDLPQGGGYKPIPAPPETRVLPDGLTVRRETVRTLTYYTAYNAAGCRFGGQRGPDDQDDRLPFTDERLALIRAWKEARYAEAHAAILATFPEAVNGEKFSDRIVVAGH